MNSKPLDYIALTIAIIGTINWGLIGFFDFNLVRFLFGASFFTKVIYACVGIAGIYLLSTYGRIKALGDMD